MYRRLEMIRAKMLEVRELSEQAARIGAAYKSPTLDGMPRNGGGSAMDARLIALESIEAIRDRIRDEAYGLQEEVRGVIEKLPGQLYTFCTLYYFSAYTAADTCRILDRDETTMYRYKREVKRLLAGK